MWGIALVVVGLNLLPDPPPAAKAKVKAHIVVSSRN